MSADAYLKARADFEAVKKQVMTIVQTIRDVANHLEKDPVHFSFTNTGTGLPPEAIMTRTAKSVDSNNWPNPTGIMALLVKFHEARSNVNTTWGAIPVSQRAGLVSPNL